MEVLFGFSSLQDADSRTDPRKTAFDFNQWWVDEPRHIKTWKVTLKKKLGWLLGPLAPIRDELYYKLSGLTHIVADMNFIVMLERR